MKQIFYLLIALITTITSIGQNNSNEISQQLLKMGLDASKQNNTQYAIQLINAWNNLGHEENKYNPYIVLPMNIWGQLQGIYHYQTSRHNIQTCWVPHCFSSVAFQVLQIFLYSFCYGLIAL